MKNFDLECDSMEIVVPLPVGVEVEVVREPGEQGVHLRFRTEQDRENALKQLLRQVVVQEPAIYDLVDTSDCRPRWKLWQVDKHLPTMCKTYLAEKESDAAESRRITADQEREAKGNKHRKWLINGKLCTYGELEDHVDIDRYEREILSSGDLCISQRRYKVYEPGEAIDAAHPAGTGEFE